MIGLGIIIIISHNGDVLTSFELTTTYHRNSIKTSKSCCTIKYTLRIYSAVDAENNIVDRHNLFSDWQVKYLPTVTYNWLRGKGARWFACSLYYCFGGILQEVKQLFLNRLFRRKHIIWLKLRPNDNDYWRAKRETRETKRF